MHAVVYKCFKLEDTEKKSPLAVKISLADDPEKKMAFQKEYEITHKLNHKNVVKAFELYNSNSTGETL